MQFFLLIFHEYYDFAMFFYLNNTIPPIPYKRVHPKKSSLKISFLLQSLRFHTNSRLHTFSRYPIVNVFFWSFFFQTFSLQNWCKFPLYKMTRKILPVHFHWSEKYKIIRSKIPLIDPLYGTRLQ